MAYHSLESHGQLIDVWSDDAAALQIQVSRTGAELVSLRRGDTGFLYRDGDLSQNPSGWNNHATVMGYYIHRLLHGRSEYRGQLIKGGTHSFLRHYHFPAPEVRENGLVYQFDADFLQPEQYPSRVDLTLSYLVLDGALEVTFRLDNREETMSHVSFGLHPGLGVSSLQAAKIYLPPGVYRRWLAPGNFLSGEVQTFEFEGGLMPFAKDELPGSFLLELSGVPERIFQVEDPASGRRVALDYQQAPYVTLWSDGGNFICVEPCWGLPDHHDQRPFADKEGVQILWPGGKMERTIRLRPEIRDV